MVGTVKGTLMRICGSLPQIQTRDAPDALLLGRITCKKLARALQIARATLALLLFLDLHPRPDSTTCLSNTHPTGT